MGNIYFLIFLFFQITLLEMSENNSVDEAVLNSILNKGIFFN